MTLYLNGTTGVSGVDGSAATPSLQGNDTNTGIVFGTDTVGVSTGGVQRTTVDSSGRLLVGTSTADSTYILGGGSLTPAVQFNSANVGLSVNRTDDGAVVFLSNSNNISTADREYGRISFNGSNGSGNLRSGAWIQAFADAATGTNDMPGRLVFSTTADGASSPTQNMLIRSDGGLYTGLSSLSPYNNTTASAANVVVTSQGYLGRSTSSIKYKTGVETLRDEYADAILNCRPVYYRSLCAEDNANWGWWGFIAEEVAKIDPRLVHWKTTQRIVDDKGKSEDVPLEIPEPEGVQYDRFVPHLLNLIKRQKEQIESMEARLTALEIA